MVGCATWVTGGYMTIRIIGGAGDSCSPLRRPRAYVGDAVATNDQMTRSNAGMSSTVLCTVRWRSSIGRAICRLVANSRTSRLRQLHGIGRVHDDSTTQEICGPETVDGGGGSEVGRRTVDVGGDAGCVGGGVGCCRPGCESSTVRPVGEGARTVGVVAVEAGVDR